MAQTMTSSKTFQHIFETKQPVLTQNKSVDTLKQEAFITFKKQGVPTHKHESWKYTTLAPLLDLPLSDQDASDSASQPKEGLSLYNGKPCYGGLQTGVSVKTLKEIDSNVSLHFSKEIASNPFSLLNTAYFSDMAFIELDQTEAPLCISMMTESKTAGQLSHPRIHLTVKEGTDATVVIDEKTCGDISGFSNRFIDIVLEKNATLKLYQDNIHATGFQFTNIHIQCHEGSTLESVSFTKDGRLSRQDIEVTILGADAMCRFNGLLTLSGESEAYQHILVNHLVPGSESHQLFKTILTDDAQAEFSGTVYVHKKAHKTNTTQLNQNLLLSNRARTLSRPQLKIEADDVLCSHGSTVGQLNDEEVFYLQSRGLQLDYAKSLLMYGFAEEIIEKIEYQPLREALEAIIKQEISGYANQNIFG